MWPREQHNDAWMTFGRIGDAFALLHERRTLNFLFQFISDMASRGHMH
jgi:hypothetical protein